jgi:hypothetical protein
MRVIGIAAAVLITIGGIGQVSADGFDGKKPFVCALFDITSCTPGGDCERETPDSANVPQFLFIDVQQSKISGTRPGGQALMTKIERERTQGDLLVLEGAEGAFSWTVSVGQSTGRMSLAAVGEDIGFMVFGDCVGASPN